VWHGCPEKLCTPGIDGRWSLDQKCTEQNTLTASSVTKQPFSGFALLTSNEEGPRKSGLNIAYSTIFQTGSHTRQNIPLFVAVEEVVLTCNTNAVFRPGTLQLGWIGHVIRMPFNRLPRRILYGELCSPGAVILVARRNVSVTT